MATTLIGVISVFTYVGSLKLNRNENSGSCNLFGGRRVVLVNVDDEYLKHGLFYNWYYYAYPYLVESNVQLVIDMQNTQPDKLLSIHELSNETAVMNANQKLFTMRHLREGKVAFSKFKAPFGSKQFKSMMTHRVEQIMPLLNQNCEVLQADIDTAWMANPFRDIDNAGTHDLILTYDNIQRREVCGCFMYFRPSIQKDDFLGEWLQATRKNGGNEQKALNTVLRNRKVHRNTVDFAVLPYQFYMPGSAIKKSAHIIHANWVVGLARKVTFLKKYHVWHESTEKWLTGEKLSHTSR